MNAVRTAERLDRDRFDLRVVAFQQDGPLRARYLAAGVPVEYLPIRRLHDPRTLVPAVRLARLVRRERIQVVHAHDRYANVFAAPTARLGTRAAVIASRRWWTAEPRRGMAAANRVAYRFAHRVLANSPAVGRLLVESEGVPSRRVVVIPNFVDDEAFQSPPADFVARTRTELGIPASAPVVGIVANLSPVKNHSLLVEAAARLIPRWPELRVVLVGEGACRHALVSQAESLGVAGHVVFAGARPHQPSFHHLFDVSVLTSRSEGFPNSVVEAMAAGRPVVATAVGGVTDAVSAESGVLIPPDDAPALAAAVEVLLSDPRLRQTLGQAGQALVRQRHAASQVLSDLQGLYEGLALRR